MATPLEIVGLWRQREVFVEIELMEKFSVSSKYLFSDFGYQGKMRVHHGLID
jgi:hypothetical protein